MYEESNSTKYIIKLIACGVSAVVALSLIFMSFETVSAGERGVVLRWGAYDGVLEEGFHVINPFSMSIKTMNVQTQKVEVTADAASKDLQSANSVVALNYHVDPARVGTLYQQIGRDYEAQVIAPAIQEAVKSGTALFTAEELISRRAEVKEAVKNNLVARLDKFYILVDDFSIVNFEFSPQFDAAIEAKQVAEQQALQAENDLRRIEVEAKQTIESAKAEAEAIRIKAQAITQQGGKDYVELKTVEKWNGVLPVNMYGSAPTPFINIK